MALQKFQADKIFTSTEILGADSVLITNEKGTIQDIVTEKEAGENIQKLSGVLTPGFINCHCHLELSHMKSLIPKHTGLVDFVFKVVTQRLFPEEEIQNAINAAEHEMWHNGIVAVGDICNNLSTLPQKKQQNLYYQNFIEASGWLPNVANIRFERSKGIYDSFKKELSSTSLVPHAPYSVSEDLWQKLMPFFNDTIATIHNQETSFEDEFFNLGSGDFVRMYQLMNIDNSFFKPPGKSSLQSYFHKFKNASSVILVHNTFTNSQDVAYANHQAEINNQLLNWCICINANKYIENALPPIEMLRNSDCNIVIGTDSLASNDSLSVLDELKSIHLSFPEIPIEEILKWATINGAKALNIQDKYGRFEQEKTPGIVLIEHLENDHFTNQSTSRRIL